MNKTLAEILLFVSVAMNASLLLFLAGVMRNVMNDMDATEFKHFLGSLFRHSTKSPFMNIVLTIPLLGAVPYLYFYGFGNRWIIAGLAVWLLAGSVSKMIKLPVFKAVADLDTSDVAAFSRARKKINAGNQLQAALTSVAAILMAVSFIHT